MLHKYIPLICLLLTSCATAHVPSAFDLRKPDYTTSLSEREFNVYFSEDDRVFVSRKPLSALASSLFRHASRTLELSDTSSFIAKSYEFDLAIDATYEALNALGKKCTLKTYGGDGGADTVRFYVMHPSYIQFEGFLACS